MPALPLQTDAFVLLRQPPADKFQSLTVFSPTHGPLLVLQRLSAKATATTTLDLFDEAALHLESSNQGQTWFVKEARLLTRHAGLGRSYATLAAASALARLLTRNSVHEESRAAAADLLRTALAALAQGAPPDLVLLKSLYRFARDEGYPVAQQWLPTLPADLRTAARELLHTPLARLDASASADSTAKILQERLANYLRGHTEILLE